MPLSYEFHLLPVSKIKVAKDRQRKTLKQIPELADSISRNGLLNPIVVTRKNELVAGERRLTAFKSLKLKEIPCHYLDELSPHEAKAIELEENLKRVDLTWQENALATEEYHSLQVSDDHDWTKKKTAEAIGLSPQHIGKLIQVANALKSKNKQVLAAAGFESAYRVITRAHSRTVMTEVAQIDFMAKSKEKKVTNVDLDLGDAFVEDFLKWAPAYSGRKFNFIHCDFPYGIGYEKTSYGQAKTWDKYDDSPELYRELLSTLVNCTDKLFFPSAHLLFWFSMNYYHETKEELERRFSVNPYPLIWYKSSGIIPDPLRGPKRRYETAFFCSLGDRKVIKSVPNCIYHKIERADHISTKPKAMLEQFFEMFVDDSTEILDPTCGSGGALAAAKILGAKRIVGLDIDKSHVETAQRGLKLARKRNVES